MSLKEKIGTKSGVLREKISRERLDAFARSIGAKPIGDEAFPIFLTAFRAGEFQLFNELGVPLSKVLHAEQEYFFENPLRAGDTALFETELTSTLDKQGGKLTFLTFETKTRVERAGETVPIGTSVTTIVVRG